MRIIRSIALVCLICTATVRAQTLADHVPKDAIAYAGWKGAETPGIGYAGSHLQAVIDASGFAQLRDELIPQVMQKITAQSKDHGEGALAAKTTLEILWRHPTAVFFAGVSPDANGKPAPKVGVICQAAGDTDALMTIFNAGAHGPDAPPMSRAFAAGDCTVFLIGYDSNDAIPSAAAGSLQSDENFARIVAQTGGDSLLCGYLDVSRAVAQIDTAVANGTDDASKAMWPRARDASGILGIKHVAFAGGFDGKEWQEQCFIDAPAPRAGLLTALEPTAMDMALLGRIPSTATMAMLGQFNFSEFLEQVRAITVAANPAAGDLFDKAMGVVQMMVGRNLQRDILAPLGSQWAIYTDASIPAITSPTTKEPMPNTGVVVVNKLVDPEKAQRGWTMLSYALSNASAGLIRSRHLPISTTMTKNGDQAVFTIVTPLGQPSWTMKDGFMYFGLSPDGAVAAANRASGEPITQQPDFSNLARQLDPTGAFSSFQYANLPASAPQSYPALQAAVAQLRHMAEQQSITLPEQILPPLEKLLPELTPALNVSWADDGGWHSRSRMPFPGASPQPSVAAVGGVALGVSILLPSLNRARETANRVKCASNERQMGQAILLFSNDHQGKYPANIADMLTEDITPEIFLCPSGNTALPPDYKTMAPADLAAWITDHGNYVYVGAGLTNATAGATDVIVYEKPEDHKQGMNILFGDGHVEFEMMPDAVKMIQDQHKTVPTVNLPGNVPVNVPGASDQAPVTPAP